MCTYTLKCDLVQFLGWRMWEDNEKRNNGVQTCLCVIVTVHKLKFISSGGSTHSKDSKYFRPATL